MDRDARSRRYDDGEVTRYGAGESYRPFNSNRSPRRPRSPPPRERAARSPPIDSDRYVPNRRRSRSPPDRYRRELSRERRDTGDSWRRGDRTRRASPRRSPPPRRSPLRRSPPPPRRFSPRRDERDVRDNIRDNRDNRDVRDVRDRGRMRSPRRAFDPRLFIPPTPFPLTPSNPFSFALMQSINPNTIPLTPRNRPRSRSFERDRPAVARERPERTPPPRPSPPPIQRGTAAYRGRSRSTERRDDRYVAPYNRRPSPPRDSVPLSSALPSRDISRRSSPHAGPPRRDDRSRPESPVPSRPVSRSSHAGAPRENSPQRTPLESANASARSPPRGPAAHRPPPTGPRDARGYGGGQSANAIGPPPRPAPTPTPTSNRHDAPRNQPPPSPSLGRQEASMSPGPGAPPSGPRSQFTPRGSGYGRGGRGGATWGPTVQSRNLPPTTGPASASPGTPGSGIPPSGPRGSVSHSVPSTPGGHQQQPSTKPFDPPKGPAADIGKMASNNIHGGGAHHSAAGGKLSFAQQLLAAMPPLVPGGKADPAQTAADAGVLPELQAHTQRLREEEERLREDKYAKEERLRRGLAEWDRMRREAKVLELRDQLAEQTLKTISGEGTGGAAF